MSLAILLATFRRMGRTSAFLALALLGILLCFPYGSADDPLHSLHDPYYVKEILCSVLILGLLGVLTVNFLDSFAIARLMTADFPKLNLAPILQELDTIHSTSSAYFLPSSAVTIPLYGTTIPLLCGKIHPKGADSPASPDRLFTLTPNSELAWFTHQKDLFELLAQGPTHSVFAINPKRLYAACDRE